MTDPISFWSRDPKWSALSNFAPVTVVWNNITFPSVEHAYLAACVDPDYVVDILQAPTARDAKILMRTLPRKTPSPDKVALMLDLSLQKFRQEPFRTMLLGTGDARLIHYAPWDEFWGTGKTGSGKNVMGTLLMGVRTTIAGDDAPVDPSTKVINIRNRTRAADEVYVGRPSIFGNPFVVGRDGPRGQCVVLYGAYAKEKFRVDPEFRAAVTALRGKTLVCYCAPNPCHGNVLAALADGKEF